MTALDIMTVFWIIISVAGFGACILANYLTKAR
jgi:hypothetical protein